MNTLNKILDSRDLRQITMQIQQNVSNYLIAKGPHAIVRTVALNDNIHITRRYNEGSKPLFDRADIVVNQHDLESGALGEHKRHVSETTEKLVYDKRSNSDKNRFRKSKSHDNTPTSSEESKSTSSSFIHSRISKVPYFRDEIREQERLRHLYEKEQHKSHSKSRNRYKQRYRSPTRYHSTCTSRRSKNKDNKYRKSRSRTRSTRRRNHSRSNREYGSPRGREHKTPNISNKDAQLTSRYITIPVALPPESMFPYAGFHNFPPPTHYSPYTVMPLMTQRLRRPMPRRAFSMTHETMKKILK
uniref:Female-specific protein transformer n=1 Tax=Glossina brevipalpis TaxID=37001 RepID=A0A1A9W460_9MUSC